MIRRERKAEWAKRRRVQRILEEQCSDCDAAAAPDRSMCAEHLAVKRAQVKARRAQRALDGRCNYCNAPAEPNRSSCAEHLAIARARWARYGKAYRRNGGAGARA